MFISIFEMSSTHCFLRIENLSILSIHGSEFLISRTFQRKRYISIACTGNFIMYVLGPFFADTVPNVARQKKC